jgi:pantothenate kinase-related protein Tda10
MAKTKEQSSKEMPATGLNLNFSKSPNVYKFIQSNSFVQGLMGPVGSGKSYACGGRNQILSLGDSTELLSDAKDDHD